MSGPFVVPKYSKAQCAKLFGPKADGNAAQKLFRENPALYREVRDSAEQHGLIGAPPRSASPVVRMVQDAQAKLDAAANRTLTVEEARACALFSADACREMFTRSGQAGASNNVAALKKSDPEKYRLAKISAIVNGVLPPQPYPAPIAAPVEPPKDTRITISDSLADDLHVARGTKVNADELHEFIAVASETKQAKESA
jgi:hypothetical protein